MNFGLERKILFWMPLLILLPTVISLMCTEKGSMGEWLKPWFGSQTFKPEFESLFCYSFCFFELKFFFFFLGGAILG